MSKNHLRVVTRGSLLALTQTRQTVKLLEEAHPGFTFEIITLTTTGDRVTDKPLSKFRGIGVFVKELEKALIDGSADIAVHSLKDVPVERVDGLMLAAFPLRKDPSDLLLTRSGVLFSGLPRGSIVGTSSPRRLVQLKYARPDLVFKDLRGNLDTRIRKLEEGSYDGIIAAAAGMLRLGKSFDKKCALPFSVCLPAAGQGSLAIECRESDKHIQNIIGKIDDALTRLAVSAERMFLKTIGGGCQTPIAVYASVAGLVLTISGVIGDPETGALARDTLSIDKNKGIDAGKLLAEKLISLCEANSIKVRQ
jgi:hydroxymethylbilane synthase